MKIQIAKYALAMLFSSEIAKILDGATPENRSDIRREILEKFNNLPHNTQYIEHLRTVLLYLSEINKKE